MLPLSSIVYFLSSISKTVPGSITNSDLDLSSLSLSLLSLLLLSILLSTSLLSLFLFLSKSVVESLSSGELKPLLLDKSTALPLLSFVTSALSALFVTP